MLCQWFTPTQLPIAYGALLFFTKFVRVLNDNLASIIYEAT